jgi:hypothetical protein
LYPGQPGFPQPAQPPKRNRTVLIVLAIVVPLVLLCCGGFAAFAFLSDDDAPTGAAPSPTSGTPAAAATTAAPEGPTREEDGAERAKVGECIDIYSIPAPSPTATPLPGETPPSEAVTATERVRCAAGTYEVLRRIDDTVDVAACANVRNADTTYSHDHSLDSLDFVLCLRER